MKNILATVRNSNLIKITLLTTLKSGHYMCLYTILLSINSLVPDWLASIEVHKYFPLQ